MFAGVANAQDFPARSITMVVPFPAGGPNDFAGRLVAEHMSRTLGQPVIVENVIGAGGTIGAARVAHAPADGYTILLHQSALALSPYIYPSLPYETDALKGVGLISYSPQVLVGRSSLSANTMPDLATWMRANSGKITFAHAGPGTLSHLCAIQLAKSAKADVSLVAYRGAAPAINDILAGHVDVFFGAPTGLIEQIQAGTMKGFGVTSKEKLDALPDVPSLVSLGYEDLDIPFWQALFVRSGTPRPILDKLNRALQLALADPAVAQRFKQTGAVLYPEDQRTPEATDDLMKAELARWKSFFQQNPMAVSNQ
jgi:tripartite-type tricarboxylate transporter receptor subunit TctC